MVAVIATIFLFINIIKNNMINRDLPLYKCEIKDDDDTGIYAMSFVDYPAVEVDFIALSKVSEHKLHLNQDKQILTGAILIPDQIIYRNDNGYEYNISFDADQIEKISHKMMKNSIVLHSTTHQHQSELSDNYLIEMWIIEDPDNDKSNALGFKNLPKGTMMASYKITDNDYWLNEVKTGNVNGFSLEGYFYDNKVNLKKDKEKLSIKENIVEMQKENTSLINRILKAINMSMDEVDSKDVTESGKNFKEFTLKDGKVIKVDEEGFATIDGEQAPSGEHILSDDAVIVINAEGYMVETVEEVKSEEPATAETELADETPADEPKSEDAPVEKFKVEIDGTEYEVDEAVANYIAALQAEIASLTEDKTATDAELATLKKNTPSASPINVNANKNEKKYTEMSRAEQIAYQMRSVLK
ncbi:MAG: XkdF-like putative serine protease domain-containing protein [Prevotella sp.]|jgi:hypothetical protein|nr:XkdF-like putative serine protease domain-containing protein [Prevotella sp.]